MFGIVKSNIPILAPTQCQLDELVAIANKRGDHVNTPAAIVAALIDRELRKELRK